MSKGKGTYHVIPKLGGGWSLRKEGAARAIDTFTSKDEAVVRARDVARNSGNELVIHGRDGTVRERATYGNDPNPPRDAKSKK